MAIKKSLKGAVVIDGVELYLLDPVKGNECWIGQEMVFKLLIASWIKISPHDKIMNPVLVGPPGCGKTSLSRAAADYLKKPVYMMNCTADMRPEDLLITPVLSANQEIRYQASSLVSAMITGGVCVLDEANRMPEKAFGSLAALLDSRRYIESITAGVRIYAHPEFRLVATLNDDYSAFTIPQFIESRLKPIIPVSFPTPQELKQILESHLPCADEELTLGIVEYLSEKKEMGELLEYSIRDALHIAAIAMKLSHNMKKKIDSDDIGSFARYVVKIHDSNKTPFNWL